MQRLAIMFGVFVLLIAVAIGVAAYLWGEDAVREGRSMYSTAQYFELRAQRRLPSLPLVAWIGDSTIMPSEEVRPYPLEIGKRLKETRRAAETIILADAGIGTFAEYCAVGKVLSLRPTAVYIIANLRAFVRTGSERGALDAASFIPASELPRAATLPWHAAGITIPRLLLARTLAWPQVREGFYFAEGLRQMFRDQVYSRPLHLPLMTRIRKYERELKDWDAPIDEQSPRLVMLRAAVELALRNGIRTTVIMPPIPKYVMEFSPHSVKGIAARSGVVGRAVSAAGARYVNLHNALATEDFRDLGGHYNRQGMDKMADSIEPLVRKDVVDLFYRPRQER